MEGTSGKRLKHLAFAEASPLLSRSAFLRQSLYSGSPSFNVFTIQKIV